MSKTYTDAEIGAAFRVLASVFGSAPAATASKATAKETPENPPADTPTSTSGSPTSGGSTITTDAFVKQALDFVKNECKGDDTKVKTLFAKYGTERLGAVPEDKRADFLADIEAMKKESALV